jgi:16S rRNA (guanine527-N7)-methyltransferase
LPSEACAFHVKHRAHEARPDPVQIGQSVRSSIEAFLHREPNALDSRFPARIEKFAIEIARWGPKMNLTAHPEDPEEITFHVLDSLMPVVLAADESSILAGRFDADQKILDLGSGAGFPGLILASASLATVTLVESRRKRASFLQVAAAEMGLENVRIESRRVEDIGLAKQYDLVAARAFGNSADVFALASKALKPGGLAMLYANPLQHFVPDITRLSYEVARRGGKVARILALYRQPVD